MYKEKRQEFIDQLVTICITSLVLAVTICLFAVALRFIMWLF